MESKSKLNGNNVFNNLDGGSLSNHSIDISNGISGNSALGGTGTGLLGGNSTGSIWIAPQSTTTYPNITTPSTTTIPMTSGTISTNSTFAFAAQGKYSVFELPQKSVPEAVYVSGRLVTLGILGSDVECAFSGDKLIFAPGVLNAVAYGTRMTLSLKYYNKTYHYNVGHSGTIAYKEGSNTMDSDLVSTISHKRK